MMRKFLPVLLAALIFIPAAEVFAAHYIPDFTGSASNLMEIRIKFTGMDEHDHKGIPVTIWNYRVLDGKMHEYVERYINKLSSNPQHELVKSSDSSWLFIVKGRNYPKLDGIFHFIVFALDPEVTVICVREVIPSIHW